MMLCKQSENHKQDMTSNYKPQVYTRLSSDYEYKSSLFKICTNKIYTLLTLLFPLSFIYLLFLACFYKLPIRFRLGHINLPFSYPFFNVIITIYGL